MRDTIRRARFYAFLAVGAVLDKADEAAYVARRRVWDRVYRLRHLAFVRASELARSDAELEALDRWWGSPF